MKQMKKLREMIPYLLVIILDFYLFPLLIRDTGSAMLILLMVIPLVCFICSLVYVIKNTFSLTYVIITTVLFIPSIPLFYNLTAWVYVMGYGVIALLGNAIGTLLGKTIK